MNSFGDLFSDLTTTQEIVDRFPIDARLEVILRKEAFQACLERPGMGGSNKTVSKCSNHLKH
jgi:hypothetical protein